MEHFRQNARSTPPERDRWLASRTHPTRQRALARLGPLDPGAGERFRRWWMQGGRQCTTGDLWSPSVMASARLDLGPALVAMVASLGPQVWHSVSFRSWWHRLQPVLLGRQV